MSELKCCPFCGGNVTAYTDRYEKVMIECDNCKMYFGVQLEIGCELKDGWKATLNSKEDAIKQWNTRTPMDNIVEKLEELKNEDVCMETSCTECKEKYKNNSKKDCYEPIQKLVLDKAINIVKQEIKQEN